MMGSLVKLENLECLLTLEIKGLILELESKGLILDLDVVVSLITLEYSGLEVQSAVKFDSLLEKYQLADFLYLDLDLAYLE